MLVLFESAVGLALFKIKDGKLEDKDIHKHFDTPESANNLYVTSPLNSSYSSFEAEPQTSSARAQKGIAEPRGAGETYSSVMRSFLEL